MVSNQEDFITAAIEDKLISLKQLDNFYGKRPEENFFKRLPQFSILLQCESSRQKLSTKVVTELNHPPLAPLHGVRCLIISLRFSIALS